MADGRRRRPSTQAKITQSFMFYYYYYYSHLAHKAQHYLCHVPCAMCHVTADTITCVVSYAHQFHNTIDEFISASSHLNKFMIDLFYLANGEIRLKFIASCTLCCTVPNDANQMNITGDCHRKFFLLLIYYL